MSYEGSRDGVKGTIAPSNCISTENKVRDSAEIARDAYKTAMRGHSRSSVVPIDAALMTF